MAQRAFAVVGLATLALLAGSAAAGATTTCSYDGGQDRLTVAMSAGGDATFLQVSGGTIEVLDRDFDLLACSGGTPTVANTDDVAITDGSGGSTSARVFEPSDFFNAGTEIDFDVALGPGKRDQLELADGFGGFGSWRYGADGINIYANEALDDVDYLLSGVERNLATGGPDKDVISGAGGEGTGGPFTRPLTISGGSGDDDLTGGSGRDLFDNGFGADVVRGGPGRDTLDYCCIIGEEVLPVRVTVGAGANDGTTADGSFTIPGRFDDVGGDIERVLGTLADDTLIGDGGRNILDGGIGRDRLLGRGGRDVLRARDFVKDRRLNCGAGRDRVRRDPFDPRARSC